MEGLSMLMIVAIIQRAVTGRPSLKISGNNWDIELVLAHEDCNKFYKYFNGKPLEVLCPEGLYFNIKYWRCDWKYNVNCSGRFIHGMTDRINDGDEITNNAESESEDIDNYEIDADSEKEIVNTGLEFFQNGCPVNPSINWLLPHEDDCNQFYYCFLSMKVKRQCPPFHHFNKRLQVCDWPRVAGCA